MLILSIDPATTTGWAVFRIDSHRDEYMATLQSWGAFVVDNSSPYQGDMMLSMRTEVINILDSMSEAPGRVHIETFFFNKKFCQGSDVNLLLRGAIYQLLRERGISYSVHAPTHWKKFVAGSSKPSKSDITSYGKTKAAKEYIKAALRDKYQIRFPERCTVKGRRVAFKHDISDATAIGIFGISVDYPNVLIAPYEDASTLSLHVNCDNNASSSPPAQFPPLSEH